MSIFNAINLGDHALISADTDAVFANGTRGNVSKLLSIPHASAVVCGRGSMALLTEAQNQFALLADFDEMLKYADVVIQLALSKHGEISIGEFAKGLELILSGYSKQAGKVTVNMFRCKAFGEETEEYLDLQNAICAGDLDISLEGITASKEGLIELTHRQVKAIREKHPDAAAGGRLLIAEVRAQSVLVETVGELNANA